MEVICKSWKAASHLTMSFAGRHEFSRGECKCGSCGHMQKQCMLDFVAVGAWPCTADLNRAATFVDERVLSHHAALKDAAPSLSTRAFLQGLAKTSLVYGGTVRQSSRTHYDTGCTNICKLFDGWTSLVFAWLRVRASIKPPSPTATWNGVTKRWTSACMSKQSMIWSALPAIQSRICFT